MTNHDDEWLTIREASLRLGVSELTIRRRIKQRKLAFRMREGKYFVNPSVRLSAPEPGDGPPAAPHVELDREPMAATDISGELVSQLTALAERAGRSAALEERVARLESENEMLRESALALSNRNGWLQGKLEERESEIKLLTDSAPRKSWLRRLFS
ncbi:MAG TPA: hypothetical protein VKX16_11860 [Chloroflexota bacterium]|nr:hypothetical protein [Chloroflexota bacterium]